MESISIGLTEVKQTQEVIAQLLKFVNTSPWSGLYSARLERLMIRAEQPCELAIAGRVKAGKSSFLNALLGDDLAMVGITETTATINFFRYGKPEDPLRPIRVVWEDGREEYHPATFLDSLQGNSKEVLERARGINRLEYLVDNQMLRYVTLVDTPGTDAIVEQHEERAEEYFSKEREDLRKKHSDQSKELTERADAVVYITEKVPTQANRSFLTKYFGNDGHTSTAMNAIGVMTKIDLMDNAQGQLISVEEVQRMSGGIAEALKNELNDVMPVSAGIYRAVEILNASGTLARMQAQIKRIPDERLLKFLLGNAERFQTETETYGKKCAEAGVAPLTCEERTAMVGTLDWRVFVAIANHLYRYPLEEAMARLYQFSGMPNVKTILERHFFQRSRTIRCSAIACELHRMLEEMRGDGLYHLRKEVGSKAKFDAFINSHPESRADTTLADKLKSFIARHIVTQEQLDGYESEIEHMLQAVETLQNRFNHATESNEALLLLNKCQAYLSPDETLELELLFGKHHGQTATYGPSRQRYWRVKEQIMGGSQDTRRLIELVISGYGSI